MRALRIRFSSFAIIDEQIDAASAGAVLFSDVARSVAVYKRISGDCAAEGDDERERDEPVEEDDDVRRSIGGARNESVGDDSEFRGEGERDACSLCSPTRPLVCNPAIKSPNSPELTGCRMSSFCNKVR